MPEAMAKSVAQERQPKVNTHRHRTYRLPIIGFPAMRHCFLTLGPMPSPIWTPLAILRAQSRHPNNSMPFASRPHEVLPSCPICELVFRWTLSAGWLRRANLFHQRAGHAVDSAEQDYE